MAALFVLGACSDARLDSDRLAAAGGWQRADFAAGPFLLRGYQRFEARGAGDLAVYIESDGLSWIDRHTLSDDPTPLDATVLALALADPSPNRVYIGRPCQFLGADARKACSPVYWASGRFAP